MQAGYMTTVAISVVCHVTYVVALAPFCLFHGELVGSLVVRDTVQVDFVLLCHIHAFEMCHGGKVIVCFSEVPSGLALEIFFAHATTDIFMSFNCAQRAELRSVCCLQVPQLEALES